MRRERALYVARAQAAHGARAETLALERTLFRQQGRLIDRIALADTPAFRVYERAYHRRVRKFEAISSLREVMAEIGRSDVAFVGDYHTLSASQRAFVEMVTRAGARGRPVAMALEFVEGRCQRDLDAYLVGRISEATFLARVGYPRRYAFNLWPSYEPVLALAKRLHLPVIGIDYRPGTCGSPALLDSYAAVRIARLLSAPERPLVMVLAGQFHVAPPHLPAALGRVLEGEGTRPPRSAVVYQNCEDLYWELSERGLDGQVEALKVGPGEYCLMNATPVACRQSFLDRVDDDGDGHLIESDPERQFKDAARRVATFLRVDVDEALEEVEVFAPGRLSFVASMRARGLFSTRHLRALRRQVLSRESCYIPRARAVYLGTLSVDHAAEEATHLVRHVIAGDGMDSERGLIDGFYARVLEEALGFFGSKIVNPVRRCARERDFSRLLRSGASDRRALSAMVLAHKRLERGSRAQAVRRLYAGSDPDIFHAVTHALGYMLGDDLYAALRCGRLPKREIRELFHDPLEEDGAAFHAYFYLAQRFGRG